MACGNTSFRRRSCEYSSLVRICWPPTPSHNCQCHPVLATRAVWSGPWSLAQLLHSTAAQPRAATPGHAAQRYMEPSSCLEKRPAISAADHVVCDARFQTSAQTQQSAAPIAPSCRLLTHRRTACAGIQGVRLALRNMRPQNEEMDASVAEQRMPHGRVERRAQAWTRPGRRRCWSG